MSLDKLKALLDDQYDWPAPYIFKFVIPAESLPLLKAVLTEKVEFQMKYSRSLKYISVTFHYHAESSDEILDIYASVKTVPGIVSL